MIRVAIVSNAVTPYRIHLHRRIVGECPDLELWSIFTHEFSNAPWKLGVPHEIRPVFFGVGEDSRKQGYFSNPLRGAAKAMRIEKELRLRRIDAVVIFGYNDLCLLHLAAWCRFRDLPCFVFGDSNIQDEQGTGWKWQVKRAILPKVLQLFSGAMFCGRMGQEYFRSYGVSKDKLFPFPYEPDYEKVANASQEQRDGATNAMGLEAGRRRILYSGRLVRCKRVDLLLTAFQKLARDFFDWDLVIAGDGPLRASLLAQIAPGLRDRIRFLGFINEPEKLAAVYGACDILVLPSDTEPWGVVVTEAATCLALVCSSRVGAGHDLVEEHRNGRIFSSGDAGSLTEALREVMDREQIDRMKAASPSVLANWRQRTDPVRGLRQALQAAGL